MRHSSRCFTASKLIVPRRSASTTARDLREEKSPSSAAPACTPGCRPCSVALPAAGAAGEALRQLPARQRRGLVQRPGLLLQQSQIVQRIEDHIFALVAALGGGQSPRCRRRSPPRARKPFDQHLAVPVLGRHRVIVGAIAHQRHRTHSRHTLLAGFILAAGSGSNAARSRSKRSPIVSLVAAQPPLSALPALGLQNRSFNSSQLPTRGIGTRKLRRA